MDLLESQFGGDGAASRWLRSYQFSAHVCCGQTAEWIKMPLGTEVDLGPGDIVRWDPATRKRGQSTPPPLFGPAVWSQ